MKKAIEQKDYSLISARQRMSPFPNYMSMESVCKEMGDYLGGIKLTDVLFFFQDRVAQMFQLSADHEHVGRAIADLVETNPHLYEELVTKEDEFGQALVAFTKEAYKKVSESLSDEELLHLFVTYEFLYKPVYAVYGSIWSMEDHIMGDLYAIVEERIKDSVKATDMLNTLTRQPSAMVATIERKALLELALRVGKNLVWKELVLSGNEEKVKADSELNRRIDDHVQAYFWLTRDYEDPVLTFADIVRRLGEVMQADADSAYHELTNKIAECENKRQTYIRELALTGKEQALFAAMRDAAHLKELRKRYVSESLYYFDDVLKEIARRLFLSVKQVRFMRTVDVERALLKGEDLTEELNQRIEISLWRIAGDKTEVITGGEAKKLFDQFCGIDKNAKEFRGMPVSPGKAKGPVKIVLNPDECGKVERGDIIVSIQVVPSFSTAIMKAAGIICDGGHGITSHPATLAREAGIPCIIQTRFAREVLKDGQMVEVDGYEGIARVVDS